MAGALERARDRAASPRPTSSCAPTRRSRPPTASPRTSSQGPLLDAAIRSQQFDGRRRRRHLPGRRVGCRRPRGQLRRAVRPRLGERGADAVPPDLRPRAVRSPRGRRRRPPGRVGTRLRIATPAGEATYRVTGTVHGPAGPPTLFFADTVAARLAGAPGKVNAIAIRGGTARAAVEREARAATRSAAPSTAAVARSAAPSTAAAASRSAAAPSTAAAVPARLEVLDRAHAAEADAGDARAADRARSSRSSARWAGSPGWSRCSSSPARSRWRSSSGGARSPCCARSAPRRTRSGG